MTTILNITARIPLTTKNLTIHINLWGKPNTTTYGYYNRTPDGKYIITLDYDKLDPEDIETELQHIQQIYRLGQIHILQSSDNSYHAVCLDKTTAQRYIEILNNTSIDQNFRNIPRLTTIRNWVLRITPKGTTPSPKYIKTLPSTHNNQKSRAHYRILHHLYPQIRETGRFDQNHNKLKIIKYKTHTNKK